MNVFKAQQISIEQEDSSISQSRIWEITQQKGGESVLFYRYGFKHSLKDGEEEALFQLGSLMQLENDIFDVYKDSQSGIYTLPIVADKVEEIKKIYTEQVNLFIELCYKMDYPKDNVKQFLDRIMPIVNRAYVCFKQYKKLEKRNNNVFDASKFSRKQLICDMEKLGNFLRTILYQVNSRY
jgi:SAM-dependent methyltransferase